MKKIYSLLFAFSLLYLPSILLAQKPNICITQPAGVTLEPSGLVLSITGSPSTHGCKDAGQPITIQANDLTNDPSTQYLFNAGVNASITSTFITTPSTSLNESGEVWVISKRPNPSATGGVIIKCASIEIIETKRPDFEFTICGSLLSDGNAIVSLNSPTNPNVNIRHRIQSIPIFGNHPSEIINAFTEEELNNNGNKRSVKLNINQPNPIIVPVLSTFSSKNNPSLQCTGKSEQYEANQSQRPIRITELATSEDKKSVTLKLEHQKQGSNYKIDYKVINDNSYLNYGQFTSPTIFSIPGALIPQTLTLNQIPLDSDKQYCFYAWEENVCALPNVPSPPVKSNEVCSIHLKSNFITGDKNTYRLRHEWNTSTSQVSSISFTEIKDLIGGFGRPVLPASQTTQESVFPSNCADGGKFQVTQVLLAPTGNSSTPTFDVTILSNPISLDNIEVPKPNAPLLVSFTQNGNPDIDITILSTPANNLYEVSYTIGDSPTKISLGESNLITQTHPNLSNPTEQFCYTYVQKVCAKTSIPSNDFCTIKSELSSDGFMLNWTEFEPSPISSSVFYDIEWVDADQDPTFTLPNPLGAPTQDLEADLESILLNNPDVNSARVRVFTRQAPGINGESNTSYSYPILLIRPLSLFIPNAFTPNGDGRNDIFKPASLVKQTASMEVFNRMGILIYRTDDINAGWDGKDFRGNTVPSGMYTYVISIIDAIGTKQTQKGSVVVLY